MAVAGCPYQSPFDPLIAGGNGTGGGGGSGGGGTGGAADAALVGSWRRVTASTESVTDTRWSFTGGGACARTVVKTLLDRGIEDTSVRPCSYTFSGSVVSIIFDGSSFVSTFAVRFADGDLLLDGFRFHRF